MPRNRPDAALRLAKESRRLAKEFGELPLRERRRNPVTGGSPSHRRVVAGEAREIRRKAALMECRGPMRTVGQRQLHSTGRMRPPGIRFRRGSGDRPRRGGATSPGNRRCGRPSTGSGSDRALLELQVGIGCEQPAGRLAAELKVSPRIVRVHAPASHRNEQRLGQPRDAQRRAEMDERTGGGSDGNGRIGSLRILGDDPARVASLSIRPMRLGAVPSKAPLMANTPASCAAREQVHRPGEGFQDPRLTECRKIAAVPKAGERLQHGRGGIESGDEGRLGHAPTVRRPEGLQIDPAVGRGGMRAEPRAAPAPRPPSVRARRHATAGALASRP